MQYKLTFFLVYANNDCRASSPTQYSLSHCLASFSFVALLLLLAGGREQQKGFNITKRRATCATPPFPFDH